MKRQGNTLVEIAIAAGVIAIVVMGFALFQTASVKANQKERDRAFAMQKCIQMMEELKAKVAGNSNTQLDDYGQADTTYSFMLTTDDALVAANKPFTPLSDNVVEAKGYRYVRQIWVRPLPRDKGARQVTVRVFRSNDQATAGIKTGAIPLASLANVFKSTPNVVLPTQQYDIYSIGTVESSLGKLDYCSYPWADANEGYQNASISYLTTATSGLVMNHRPIRLMTYGRDTYYSPVNNDHDYWTWYYDHSAGALIQNGTNTPLNGVYFRPGKTDWWFILNPGYGQSSWWYTPTTDDGDEPAVPTRYIVKHGNTAPYLYENQPFYTFADQNNHAVRYYENIEKQFTRGGKTQSGTAVANPFLGIVSPPAPATNEYAWASTRWGGDTYELTLRGLLDEMLEGSRKNAIIVNNHGALFPFIPMRNFSDPAKVPSHSTDLATLASQWGVTASSAGEAKDGAHCRMVTHPRNLEYDQDDIVELRTFNYIADPDYLKKLYDNGIEPPSAYRNGIIVLRGMRDHLATWNGGTIANNIEVQVEVAAHGKDPGTADEKAIYDMFTGDSDPSRDDFDWWDSKGKKQTGHKIDAYRWVRAWPPSGSLVPKDDAIKAKGKTWGKSKNIGIPYWQTAADTYMRTVVKVQTGNDPANGLLDGDVIINLKNLNYTPDRFQGKENGSTAYYGFDKNMQLYGQNYFPDPELPDLSDGQVNPTAQPRNSSRVRIFFKTNKAKVVEVLSTLGDDPNLLHHQAPNRERTWVWVGTNAPETERYQLIGDPRHNPYLDVRDDQRYNRYFGDLDDAYFDEDGDTDWNYYGQTANGWGPNVGGKGKVDVDVPRYFELWRKALLNANAMLSTPSTNAFEIIALGGEYGGWSPGAGVTHSKQPMTGETKKQAVYDEWKNPTLVASKDKKWCAKPWLGEMYPDDEWASWYASGNLPSNNYRRLEYQDIDAFKNNFPGNTAFKRTKYLDHWGPMSFFNATTQFQYKDAAGTAKIAGAKLPNPTDGRAVTSDLKANLTETFHTYRSFTLNDGSATPPDDYGGNEAKGNRTVLENGLVDSATNAYYLATDGKPAIAPFTMKRGGQAAYFLGFTPWNAWSGANDPYTITRVFEATTLQAYLDMASPKFAGGSNKGAARIRLLPRINVTKPEDDALVTGSSCVIEWTPEWVRWDGKPYSRQFSTYGASGDEPSLTYVVKYSEDGKSWRYGNTTSGASIGASARFNSTVPLASQTTNTTLTLNTSTFKNKQYQVRVEAWRTDPGYQTVHHAYSQFSINYTK